jgi:hypothetical protein
MSGGLGLDHPLVAVRDLAACRDAYTALGFQLTPMGQHPWGTATTLVLFHHQILELVGIGDATLLDGYPAGGFRFGRHVEAHLETRDGVALSALFTQNAEASEAALKGRGIACVGTIEFGRDVTRADGEADRTRTTLKIFPNPVHPRLSVFACQQHRRDLLEFPHLMTHPNGAHGIEAVTVVCEPKDRAATQDWLARLHDAPVIDAQAGVSTIATANGVWRVCDPASARMIFGPCDLEMIAAQGPTIIGIDVRAESLAKAMPFLKGAIEVGDALVLNDMTRLGGVMLRFVPKPRTAP